MEQAPLVEQRVTLEEMNAEKDLFFASVRTMCEAMTAVYESNQNEVLQDVIRMVHHTPHDQDDVLYVYHRVGDAYAFQMGEDEKPGKAVLINRQNPLRVTLIEAAINGDGTSYFVFHGGGTYNRLTLPLPEASTIRDFEVTAFKPEPSEVSA